MGSIAFVHLVVIFASVIVLSHAMPARQEDVERLLSRLQQQDTPARYDDIGHNVRNLDSLGGGNLLRDTRGMDSLAGITFGGVKRFDSLSGITFGGQKRSLNDVVPYEHQHYYPQCLQPVKRVNFDEIDHSGFVGFQKKNFDEIDHSNFGSFVKREPSGRLVRLRY